MGVQSLEQFNMAGKGFALGHPISAYFDPSVQALNAGFGNRVRGTARNTIQAIGTFHDEGGQVPVLRGEFFGDYLVRVGTQAMFDNGEQITCYSGIAGDGQTCKPYARQRRLAFVTPMGLPLGTIKVVATPIQSSSGPIRGTIEIVRRPLFGRLHTIASAFPESFATRVPVTMREREMYD